MEQPGEGIDAASGRYGRVAVSSSGAAVYWAGADGSDRAVRRVLTVAAAVAGLLLAGYVVTSLRARHELTQVESIVGMHAAMLAGGDGLYYDLQQYPFTISPYGPVFYSLSAALQRLGLPVLAAGRLISVAALLAVLFLSWRLLMLHTGNRAASFAGTILLASSANVLYWGTVGQVDMLGLCFSLAAFLAYSRYQACEKLVPLVQSGVWIVLAIFTKQTFLAAGAAITLLVFLNHRRRGAWFAACTGLCGLALALALNGLTAGRFFDNAVLANLNPFSAHKAWQHLDYFLPVAGCLLLLAAAVWMGPRRGRFHPFHVYLAAAAGVMALTAPKVGSDLNYQIETMVALCLCAGWSLHRLDFFPLWLRGDPGWVTLLQIPVLLYLTLNAGLAARTVLERSLFETLRRSEVAALSPYLENSRGPVLSVQIDPLLQAGKRLEVEPLIYTLLVDAGAVDPEPVLRDLEQGRFGVVLLYEDVNGPKPWNDPELPSLPDAHLRAVRESYRLIAHIPGPLLQGDYIYVPR
ncbi:MAG: glycosyltransferase family 39 protein [Bryobacterales bacterium]